MGWHTGSGISLTTCKSFAPRSRQTTTPVPHHFLMPNQQRQSTEGIRDSLLRRKFKNLAPASCRLRPHIIILNHQFWAPRQNSRCDRPRKVQFLEFQKPRDLDLDLGSGWSQIMSKSEERFVDGRSTYLRTDGQTHQSSSLLGCKYDIILRREFNRYET